MKFHSVQGPLENRRGARQGNNNTNDKRKSGTISTSTAALVIAALVMGIYMIVGAVFLRQQHDHITRTNQEHELYERRRQQQRSPKLASPRNKYNTPADTLPNGKDKQNKMGSSPHTDQGKSSSSSPRSFQDWKQIAMDLAAMTAPETLQALENEDPFGVRTFEQKLLAEESAKGEPLTLLEIQTKIFACPTDRISHPDLRNHTQDQDFRDGHGFLFFQHLRKAGGTNFCSLAQANLPKKAVPPYFCMPDMYWKEKRCAGCLQQFTNEYIIEHMGPHRIAGNEWDNFESKRHFDLPAIFATSFRRPLDRAISQFRFECIEDRGCKFKQIEPYWEKRQDLSNVFTRTFSDTKERLKLLSQSTNPADGPKRAAIVGDAVDTLSRFHLVLVMEWLAYAAPMVETVLGFHDTSALTHRVRPHIGQYKRDDGQEENKLGASGIAKASWTPKKFLSSAQYKVMSEDLALDEIVTDVGRRFFLERLVCGEY